MLRPTLTRSLRTHALLLKFTLLSGGIAAASVASTAHADEADPIGNIIQSSQIKRVAYRPQQALSEAFPSRTAQRSTDDPINALTLSSDVQIKGQQQGSTNPDPLTALISQQPQSTSAARGSKLVDASMDYLGTKYRWGGKTPAGFDCSGFVQYLAKKHLGMDMPRVAADQAKFGTAVSRDQLQPGDLVFFNTSGRRNSHVGIYIGDNQMVHAPRTGARVRVEKLSSYWTKRYNGARRLPSSQRTF